MLRKTDPDPYSGDWKCSAGRRRLKIEYGKQTVRETKRNADAFETRTLLKDVYRQTLRLLVKNISSSSPAINKRRRLLPAISVTTCGTMVRWRRVDNTWPVTALTARREARHRLRVDILAYTPPAFDAFIRNGSRRNIAMAFRTEKLESCGYPTVKKKFADMFIRFDRMYQRDRHTHLHGQTPHDG